MAAQTSRLSCHVRSLEALVELKRMLPSHAEEHAVYLKVAENDGSLKSFDTPKIPYPSVVISENLEFGVSLPYSRIDRRNKQSRRGITDVKTRFF